MNAIRVSVCLLVLSVCNLAAQPFRTHTEAVGGALYFHRPLEWLGDRPPAEEESKLLLEALERWMMDGKPADPVELETFLGELPESPWAASLHACLGHHYLDHGRYSMALRHWERAYEWTGQDATDPGKRIADYTLAFWTRLLASLGRVETLAFLYEENAERVLDGGPLSQRWERTREALNEMIERPGVSYKCGTYALDQVARTLGFRYDARALVSLPSPDTGFSVKVLADLANELKLGLEPVLREAGEELVVPSVVHWSENHYAAIVDMVQDETGTYVYKVIDPTFGNPRFLTVETINLEASGVFLVPAVGLSPGWRSLSDSEARDIYGRGNPNVQGDINDQGCDIPCPPGCPPGGPNPPNPPRNNPPRDPNDPNDPDDPAKPNNPPDCGDCDQSVTLQGMVHWRVSEPYINLWMEDEPLGYQPARGRYLGLRVAYKQRDETYETKVFNFGPGWNSNWKSYVFKNGSASPVLAANVLLPGGGVSYFGLVNGWGTNYHNNFRLRVLTNGVGTVTSYELYQPDGAKIVYDFFRTDIGGSNWIGVFMTQWVDKHGFVTQFKYLNYDPANGNLRLGHVIDADNKTNVVNYLADDLYNWNRIGSVTDPYGRIASFGRSNYPAANVLTNIVDVAGMSSSFTYNGSGWPLTLTTPYGQTSFAMTSGSWPALDRAIIISEPGGTRQAYAFVQYCDEPQLAPYIPPYASSQVPTNTPMGTLDNEPGQRNSFYWNRQQMVGLPVNYGDFWNEQWYWDRARLRHWLGGAEHGDFKPIDTLSIERMPSPDDGITEGQTTWFDYVNKGPHGNDDKGTQILPAVIARRLPDGSCQTQWFQRSAWGNPTNIIETYTYTNGTIATRTNSFTYSADGIDLVSVRGASGQLLAGYNYNSYRQVLRMTNALNQVITNSYDATWRQLTNVGRPSGLNTALLYDSNRRLQKTIDVQITRTNSYTYYSNGLVQTHTDPRGLVRTFTWDNLQRLTRIDYPDSSYESRTYTALDLTASRDRLGHWTNFGYNGLRQQVAETNALGTVTRFEYCGCGSVDSVTEAWNTAVQRVTQFDYDLQGNRIKTYFPDGTTQTNWFNRLGQLIATGDALGQRWFGYNVQGLLTSVTNAFGLEHKTIYDIEDRPWAVTDANGVTVLNTYDSLDRLLTRTAPDGGIERFLYTARGLVAYTNQLSKVWRYEYDAASRKTAETNANLEVIRYTYNAAGDLKTLTDGKIQVTTWNYDLYGRVTNKVDQASTQILRYQYDADHRLTNRWSAAKGNTAYSYNNIGNVTLVNYPSSTDITMQYDALGRLTNRVDATGTTKYTYHLNGQLLTEDSPWDYDTVTYGYNNARLRNSLSLQQPTGNWTNGFTYDGARRLATVTSPAGTYTYSYKGPGVLVTNLVLPNTSRITNVFDNVGRLTMTKLRNSGGTALNTHSYLYNQGHQRYRQTRTDSSYATYTYDNIGQLKSALGTGGESTENLGYAYDTAWNLNTRTNYGTPQTFQVNVKNELTNAVGLACTYDANGNLTNRVYDATGPKTYIYVYDDENQLTEMRTDTVNTPSGSRWRTLWVYDGTGRARIRVDYTWSGTAWVVADIARYVYDGMRVIQERNTSNTPTVSYTRGNDLSGSLEGAGGIGGMLSRSHGYSSGSWSTHNHYHADGNGNVTYLVNSGQTSEAIYRYDPYGRTMTQSGSLATANRYRFSSKEVHSQSGMYYYGYRFYEPHLQRWVNRDPIGDLGSAVSMAWRTEIREEGLANSFGFVGNRPQQLIDPNGLVSIVPLPMARGPCVDALRKVWERAVPGARGWGWGDPPDNDDRFEHCRSSCELARACGKAAASALGGVKEGVDWLKGGLSNPGKRDDMLANAHGRKGTACPDESCEDYCRRTRSQYPPSD
jgi:RHS repeat-associated protein